VRPGGGLRRAYRRRLGLLSAGVSHGVSKRTIEKSERRVCLSRSLNFGLFIVGLIMAIRSYL
jgi:hypothetical protein